MAAARTLAGGFVLRLPLPVVHSALYRMQFEHVGCNMSHLIFLVKHKSQATRQLVVTVILHPGVVY